MIKNIKQVVKKNPLLGKFAIYLNQKINPSAKFSSGKYWENRYRSEGNSGVGSYDKLAEFKAEIVNNFVDTNNIESAIEYGCGDGNQLKHLNFRSYLGFDVSDTCIQICLKLFETDHTKRFKNLKQYAQETAQLTLSLDVVYHLIEDQVYFDYMNILFSSSRKYVIIYSSNFEDEKYLNGFHVKHRKFTKWVELNAPHFILIEHISNKYPFNGNYEVSSFADFYIFERK